MARPHYSAMGFTVRHAPATMSASEILNAMLKVVTSGGVTPLPPGLIIDWTWENAPGRAGPASPQPINDAATESRAGFLSLMITRIQNEAAKLGVQLGAPEIPQATPEVMELIEEQEEGREEKQQRAVQKHARKRKAKKRRASRRRRKASKIPKAKSSVSKKGKGRKRAHQRRSGKNAVGVSGKHTRKPKPARSKRKPHRVSK